MKVKPPGKPSTGGNPHLYFGFWIAAVAFLSLALMAGCSFYIFGLFVKPFEAEFGWGRAQIMAAATFFSLSQGSSSILVGRLIDNYGSRRIMLAGSIIIGVCFVLVSAINSLWQLYLLYGISGAGFAAIGFVPATALVFNWFRENRGKVVGFITVGIGIGGFTMPLLVGNGLIPNLGWRTTFLIVGLMPPLILIPLLWLVVREKPGEKGLLPHGETEVKSTGSQLRASAGDGFTARMALKTPAFWLIASGSLLFGFSTMAVTQNQVPHLIDIGFSTSVAASAVSIVGAFSGIGKFIFGFLCDLMNPKYARAIGLSLQLTAVIIIINLSSVSPVVLVWLYAVLIGLSFGSWVPSLSMLTSTNFGLVAYGSILGMMAFFDMGGGAIGPLFAGYIYDIRQSYLLAFNTFLILIVIAIMATLLIRRPKIH